MPHPGAAFVPTASRKTTRHKARWNERCAIGRVQFTKRRLGDHCQREACTAAASRSGKQRPTPRAVSRNRHRSGQQKPKQKRPRSGKQKPTPRRRADPEAEADTEGNRIRSFLEIITPDVTPSRQVGKAIMECIDLFENKQLPLNVLRGDIAYQFDLDRALAPAWRQELEFLLHHALAVRV